MREWVVAGGVVEGPDGLLLVQNQRRNGSLDWSTPGGVIDEGETLIEGLTREVFEETGLSVTSWIELAYRVEVHFETRDMTLSVETHVADQWTGDVVIADPDGIVVAAEFVDVHAAESKLATAPQWVGEPLSSWLSGRTPGQTYRYLVTGDSARSMRVERQ